MMRRLCVVYLMLGIRCAGAGRGGFSAAAAVDAAGNLRSQETKPPQRGKGPGVPSIAEGKAVELGRKTCHRQPLFEEAVMKDPRAWFVLTLIVVAAASRLVPHPPNVTPLAAVALFGGATFERRWTAFLVPLAALLLSDLLLQAGYLAGWQPNPGFYPGQWVVYTGFVLTATIGVLIRRDRGVLAITLAAVAGSSIFFLLTNFAVWMSGLMYPRTAAGLRLCYETALPFLRNSLLGDLAYCLCLFGALAEARFPVLRSSGAGAGTTA
jgi:hypothetical protein